MVILITGASHTGKTRLAQSLLEAYKYPYLSLDHLKMGLIRSGNTCLTVEDDEGLTDYLWPIVREMIKTAIENRQNLVVEGCYVPFDWEKDLDAQYLPFIRYICLAMADDYIDKHFGEIRGHSCDIESRMDDSFCTVEQLKRDNRMYREGCARYGNPAVLIDGDYEGTMERVLSDCASLIIGRMY